MRDHGRVHRRQDVQRNAPPVDPVEQADPGAENDRGQRDRELIDQARIEVLQDRVGAAGDTDILALSAMFMPRS